jgi:DNA-directed RNA polymerase subunit RPC12/RpoP
MKHVEAFCVRCRKKVRAERVQEVRLKNGRIAQQGRCPTCGGKVFRMGGAKN